MGWQYTPVTPLLLVSLVLSLSLAAFLLLAVDREGRRAVVFGLVGMLAGAAWWSATSLVQLSRTELSVMLLAEQLEYVGGTAIVLSWFVFAFAYTDRDQWLTPRAVVVVATPLVISTLLAITNRSHELLWTAPRRVDAGGFLTLSVSLRPGFFLHLALNYVVILAGIYVLARLVVGPRQVYRGQAAALIGSAVIPMLANVATVFGLGPWPNVDLSAVAFVVSGTLLAFAITRYELLDLEPVARRRVVQQMRDGFVVVDDSDRVVDLNSAASDFIDVDPGAAVGRELPELAPEVDDLVADDGTTSQTEFAVGEAGRRHVQARLAPIDHAGADGGRLLLLRDVTDRREVERRYQRLVEKATDVVFVLDADGTITYVSPAVENVLGAPPDYVTGADAREFVHPDDRDGVADLFERGLETPGATYRVEFRVQRWDGEWTHLEAIGRNLLDDPFVEGIVVNARDITERTERERELERQNERLAEFASVVSHDLRNPLEVARGHLELARESDDESDRRASVERVADAHDRMDDIIEDVLALAREGQAVTEPEPVAVETVAREAWTAVETDGATLELADPPTAAADPERLRRLLENLFRNAVEHGSPSNQPPADDAVEHGSPSNQPPADDAVEHGSPSGESVTESATTVEGGGAVTITVGRIDPTHTGTRVETGGPHGFFVEDDGPGLPEADDDLFEFGYTTGDDGTGIGLAIVADIAEAHGWTVETAESAPGGARFEFTGLDGADGTD